MRMAMIRPVLKAGLVGALVALMASPATAQGGGVTEIFIPGGAFALDDAGSASYRHARGCVSAQCFSAQGVWLPEERGLILVGTTFWIPTEWFDREVEIILYAHSGMVTARQVRIAYAIGNLGIPVEEELTTFVGPEDDGGSQVPLLTTTLGSTDPVPGGSVLANQQYQGITVGINGDHPDNQHSCGILGLLIRLTGN